MQDLGIHQTSPIQYRIGSLKNPRKFRDQNFEFLRNHLLSVGQLFEDDTFPADSSIIGDGLQRELNIQNLEWKRPKDFCSDPHLFVEGVNMFDIRQGELGDCWVLSTMGALASKPMFLRNVIPQNQSYSVEYAGIFHFRFWHFGEWVDVVIDDRLPFRNGNYLSVEPSCHNEFWPCLLEKAYAKLQGSYQNLHWGNPSEALVNFSSGVAVEFHLNDHIKRKFDLLKIIYLASENAMMAATIGNKTTLDGVPIMPERSNREQANGLLQSHAYTVTNAVQVCHEQKGPVDLIRLWNPWCKKEWNGPWSDTSDEWNGVTPAERKELYENKDNGEFWMPWEHFFQEFSHLYICNYKPVFLDFGRGRDWHRSTFFGRCTPTQWDTMWENPQYLIRVTENDVVTTGHNVLVALMQNPDERPKFTTTWLPIGFGITEIDQMSSHEKLPQEFFSRNKDRSLNVKAARRELTSIFNLAAGTYVVVPFTSENPKDLSFMLRIFLKSEHCAKELGKTQPDGMPKRPEETIDEQIFAQYAEQSLGINAWQLQRILNEVILKDEPPYLRGEGFSLDASREILAAMDYLMDGRLDVKKFTRLCGYLRSFKAVFRENDVNASGFLDMPSFQNALQTTEIVPSQKVVNVMFKRYGDSSERLMNHTDFLRCLIRFKTTCKAMKILGSGGKRIHLSNEEWMQMCMYH